MGIFKQLSEKGFTLESINMLEEIIAVEWAKNDDDYPTFAVELMGNLQELVENSIRAGTGFFGFDRWQQKGDHATGVTRFKVSMVTPTMVKQLHGTCSAKGKVKLEDGVTLDDIDRKCLATLVSPRPQVEEDLYEDEQFIDHDAIEEEAANPNWA
ncbi:MAG: hypothetical protein HQL75_00410 [Magnetococcales bacterium]|nr:hypothetical protein [Magnetococcales bacterium]